jgi:hypothetical protein
MAKLFLSYSRKDEPKAQRFTAWLEREGHDVWRDEDDIGVGASFSSEIEKALTDSDAVLVLWSANSAQSAWVRDEAGFGRDKGKLIPFSLDGSEPPLGFRQFQSIDISRWKGHGAPPAAERINAAIERVAHLPQSTRESTPPERRAWIQMPAQVPAVIGALAAVLILVAGLAVWHRWPAAREVAIAVLPSPQSPDRVMAADYANVAAADMAAFLPRRFDRVTVISPADAVGQNSGYRMLISTDPHGAAANATLTLSDQDGRTTLWSDNWSVADASAADLKGQVSAAASKAAYCLTDARGGSTRLTQPALGLFISGCATLGADATSDNDMGTIFERVTKLTPDFGPAWSYLALTRAWTAEGLRDSSPAAYAAAVQNARNAISIARKLNPKSGMSYDAEYHLNSNDDFRGLQILEKGARIDPDDGRIQMHLSEEYMSVGRMQDSVAAAQNGAILQPGSSYTRSQYIVALVYAGQFSKAKADIAEARKKWPKDPNIDWADFTLQFRYGDPQAALALMPRMLNASDASLAPYRLLIAARMAPSAAKIDGAITALGAVEPNSPATQNKVLLALANFGRVDEAYDLMENPKFQTSIERSDLFRPDFAGIRADPRFMQIAARLGLVRYWRQTGYWPDFCTSEQLKYDCKTEAAKYG